MVNGTGKRSELFICSSCGETVPEGKYCSNCGSRLDRIKPAAAEEKAENVEVAESDAPEPKAMSDEGLTLLVNTCRKTIATVGGDGYSEIVLYLDEATGDYWLHTYSKYVYMSEEAHASYKASPKLAQQVMEYIKEHNLASWTNKQGLPLSGGDYILRFKQDNEWVRLDSSNLMNAPEVYTEIDSMLRTEATEENRRYADQ